METQEKHSYTVASYVDERRRKKKDRKLSRVCQYPTREKSKVNLATRQQGERIW